MIINSIYNPLSVILRVRNQVIASQALNSIKEGLLKEGMAVARSEGVELEFDLETLNRIVSSRNITSMLQDYLKGKPTEIEFINGAIIRIAKKNKILLNFRNDIGLQSSGKGAGVFIRTFPPNSLEFRYFKLTAPKPFCRGKISSLCLCALFSPLFHNFSLEFSPIIWYNTSRNKKI